GGTSYEFAFAVAVDPTGTYVTGETSSANFPIVPNPGAAQTTYAGAGDAFITKLITVGSPTTLVLTPPTATNQVGTQHTVTATVRDVYGNPVPNVTVVFSVPTSVATHASPASGSATTNSAGQAQFCYTASLPGIDAIEAFADTNGNGMQDLTAIPPEPSAAASKIWIPPVSSGTCKITNAGSITAINGDRATFSGEVHVA